jgi:hypothetical protein
MQIKRALIAVQNPKQAIIIILLVSKKKKKTLAHKRKCINFMLVCIEFKDILYNAAYLSIV